MKQARIGWVVGTTLALLVLTLPACEPKGSTATGAAAAPAGAKPAVTVREEPMKPEEVAAATAAAGASAQAVLQPGRETSGFSGKVTFTQVAGGVRVVANVAGVAPPGNHGFHLHENGRCEPDPAGKDFTTAGGHFNPAGAPHACPDAASHHAGDLGNIVIQADGSGHLDVTTSALTLSGPSSVIGRSVILHAGTDDCATQPTGNAGGRLACGVVTAASGG
ncbi:MAG TPA: superoxide dismutase family protein [Thermoanaerobaculia bacterium]|jgi:Cu-Zn family superoxide dismutase|nr:superoxide dismutase family protein [Thermoanaerobaculia bacterium]